MRRVERPAEERTMDHRRSIRKSMNTAEKKNGMTGRHVYVLIASCIMAWGVMGMINAYGVFFTPMEEALGTGRAAATLHYSLRMLAVGLASPLAARLIDKKISIKKTIPAGLVIFLACSLIIARSRSVILVDILAVIAGFSYAFFCHMIITIILGNWFHKNLGTFSGIVISFSGIGAAIASPIVTKMLASLGYQTTYSLYALATVLMVVPILFCHFTPEEAGLKPYGEGQTDVQAKKVETKYLDMPYRLMSGIAFAIYGITVLSVGLTTFNSHMPALAQSREFTADIGALLLSASMIGNLVFKLVLGVIMDRLGVIKGFLIVLVITLAGLVMIFFVKGAVVPLIIGGFLYGTVFSLGALGMSLLTRYIYGNEQYNQVYALVNLMTNISTSVFVLLIGALYDATQAYTVPLIMGICMVLLCMALIGFLTAKVKQARKTA